MAWTEPKTDWSLNDFFNLSDFNRIKNNLNYLHEESQKIWGDYQIADMGADLTDYTAFWEVALFNAIEDNLETINRHMLNATIGNKQTFYPNGKFIGYAELNRIESATVTLKATIDGWYEGMAILPFRLGNKGGVRT